MSWPVTHSCPVGMPSDADMSSRRGGSRCDVTTSPVPSRFRRSMRHAARLTAPPHARVPSVLRLGPRVGPWTSFMPLLVAAAAVAWFAAGPATPSRVLYAAAQETDTDGDMMPDAWETFFGLNPGDPADAGGDPDGDGLTNAQEDAARRHPVGLHAVLRRRFDRLLRHVGGGAQPEPDRDQVVTAPERASTIAGAGRSPRHPAIGGPRQRRIRRCGHGAAAAEATRDRIVRRCRRTRRGNERDRSPPIRQLVRESVTTWYFAEGATGPFLLYYLFENPATRPANVSRAVPGRGGRP